MKIDFSQKAVEDGVKQNILQNPLSTYSIVGGILGLFIFNELLVLPFLMGISTGAIVFGAALIGFNFLVRKKIFQDKYLTRLNSFMSREKNRVLELLNKDLEGLTRIKSLKIYAGQAVKQYKMIDSKFSNFKKIIEDKFDAHEITYGRFMGTAEQLYLSVLDNLESILNRLETIKNIDSDYIETRLSHLNNLTRPEPADEREKKTLNVRKKIKEDQLSEINDLLTLNEEAMTQIDLSMSELSAIKTRTERGAMDVETAREELEELINRIKKYSNPEKTVVTSVDQEVLRSRK